MGEPETASPLAAGQKIVEAVAADPVVQAAVEHAADPGVLAGARAAAVAIEEAAVLQSGGVRDAAVLAAAGQRDAAALRVEGQRNINLIWETTQMRVALSVIWCSLVAAAVLAVFGRWLGAKELQLAAVVFVFGASNLVIGFYFGRTNHARTGGIGDQDPEGR